MDIQHNVVGWFEIPVANMERAVSFYESVFGLSLTRHRLEPLDMAWFPWVETGQGSSGALVLLEEAYKPSRDGVLVYFTAFSGDVAVELARVEAAGGKVLEQKKLISEDVGYMGLILDSEGNRIAIHSRR